MMNEADTVAHLGRIIEAGLNDEDGSISSQRVKVYKAYNGDPYGNEREGRSSVVTREVLETIEWAKPHIMRIFGSGDRVVAFNPVGLDDEARADQETDIVRHVLFEENNGFMTLYNWISEALLYPVSYAKIWPDVTEEVKTENYESLTEIELKQVMFDTEDEIEPLEATLNEDFTYDIKLKRIIRDARIRFEACEPEQVIIDQGHTKLSLEDCDAVIHRVKRTKSWLISNGYDKDRLDLLGSAENQEHNDERANRLFYEDENPDYEDESDESMREFWVHECYVKLDFDEDDIAESRRIVMIGAEIFENEEDDYNPFVALSCVPQPHKHTGTALGMLAMVWQRVKTAITRGMLDNIYQTSINKTYLGERAERPDGETEEDFQDAEATLIRVADPTAIGHDTTQNKTVELLQAMQEIDENLKLTTGVSPDMSMSPDVLKESTMGAFMGALEQASERIELVARVFAETGVKDAMYKTHRLMREHMDKGKVMRMRGKWVEVDPTAWRERKDLTVEVGTGFKSKEKRLALMERLLKEQKESLTMGLPTVTENNIYQTQLRLADAMGERNPALFFSDPADAPPKQQAPNPALVAIESTERIEGQKRQIEMARIQKDDEIKKRELLLSAKRLQLDNYRASQAEKNDEVIDWAKLKLEYDAQELEKEIAGMRAVQDAADRAQKAKTDDRKLDIEEDKLNAAR